MNPYIKSLGFTNQASVRKWMTARDILIPNWELIESRNQRLSEMFTRINNTLPIRYGGDIGKDIEDAYRSIRGNGLLLKMKNNGRAMEDVYYTWMQGYICEKVFIPFICDRLMLNSLTRNGKDDVANWDSFKRKADADLLDVSQKVFVDVQCGTHVGKTHIKKHKVDKALQHADHKSYVFSIRLMHGTWCSVDLNQLGTSGAVFYKNELWENCLCWDIPDSLYRPYYGLSHILEDSIS